MVCNRLNAFIRNDKLKRLICNRLNAFISKDKPDRELSVTVFFVWEFFTHLKTSPLLVKGCKYWPMHSTYGHWAEGSLRCHTSCDTRHPFIMVISKGPWHSLLLPSVWQWSCQYMFFTTKVCLVWDSNTQPSACEANALTHCATAAVSCLIETTQDKVVVL